MWKIKSADNGYVPLVSLKLIALSHWKGFQSMTWDKLIQVPRFIGSFFFLSLYVSLSISVYFSLSLSLSFLGL